MRVDYTPTFADYWALNVFVLKRQFRWIGRIAVLLLVLFVAYPLFPQPNRQRLDLLDAYRGGLQLLILPGIVVFTVIVTHLGARRRWSQSEELREARAYEFDEQGVHVQSKSITAFAQWTIMKEAAFTHRFVYVITGQRQCYFFPASAVSDIAQLRELVERKVPKVKNA